MFAALTPDYHVAPQLTLADIAAAGAAGFALVVNNRPDGEDPEAPQGEAVAAAAAAAGIAYVAIPVGHAGFSAEQLDALDAALAAHPGRTLAYCRSGTRSTLLWALAAARRGEPVEALNKAAYLAGYSLAPIAALLDALASKAPTETGAR